MQSAVPAKKRKNYDGEPKFGTVKDIYKKGEDGLLAETAEEEEQIRVDQMPDWEKKLTFSEDFDGIKKGNKDKNKGKQKP